MPRFVVLHHRPGQTHIRDGTGPHYDWMFEWDDALRTWATELIQSFDEQMEAPATQLGDHRIHYLDFQGEISNDRGTVHQVLSGWYESEIDVLDRRFVVMITWLDGDGRQQNRRVDFYRNLIPMRDDEACDGWRLRLELCR